MAERILSPGVFTRENDQSFLAQGIAQIGGAIVAPFAKGVAFSPVLVQSQADLETLFGVPDGTYYGPYTAQQYLKNQGTVTICRVGGLGGYTQKDPIIIKAIPGTTLREEVSSVYSGSLVRCTVNEFDAGEFSVTASIRATFYSGYLSGSSMIVGDITASIDSTVDGTGSLTLGYVEGFLSNSHLPGNDAVSYTGNLVPQFLNPCTTRYNISGIFSGSYGPLDPSTFVEDTEADFNNCTEITSHPNQLVLFVLANTAYDASQRLEGFSGSYLAPVDADVVGADYNLRLISTSADSDGNVTSNDYGTYRVSLDPGSPSYITNVFGTSPLAGQVPVPTGFKTDAAYVYKHFDNTAVKVLGEMVDSGSWKVVAVAQDGIYFDETLEEYELNFAMRFQDDVPGGGGGVDNTAWSAYDIRQAETPWVTSQNVATWTGAPSGSTTTAQHFELFKVHTIADGTYTNTAYKIEISNVKLAGTVPGSTFGSFNLAVRAFDDTDRSPVVLEQFQNLTLDPNDANYVARRIGDRWSSINFSGKILEFGDFNNKSKLIRIEMTRAPYPKTAVPYGFEAYASPIGGEYSDNVPPMVYTKASVYSANVGRYASGVIFNPAPASADAELLSYYPDGSNTGVDRDNKQYFAPLPDGTTSRANINFDLETFCSIPSTFDAFNEPNYSRMRKFCFGFQGGFDGQSPSKPILLSDAILPANQQGLDCATILSSGSVGYKQCLGALGNADEFDINLLVTPGINYQQHSYVAKLAIDTCEARGDAFYIMDLYSNQTAGGRSVQNIVDTAAELDSSYAGAYYPWVKINDTNTNRLVSVPPSVLIPAIYAQNDKVAAEWFAPAGLNRGGIPQAVQVLDRLTHTERDTLYEGRVNPIAAFPGQGIVVWGQKTLQVKPSALDRINVRRLLIALKKFIASSSRYLVFEQNESATRNRFLSIVNPYLESVQQRKGLYAFKVVCDASNNTPADIDRNILRGAIYLQPTKVAEFIIIDFNILPTGATFSTN